MKKILILAANPHRDLDLDQEITELQDIILNTQRRNDEPFEVIPRPATKVEVLQRLMLEYNPNIVHFCGHGGGEAGLILLNQQNQGQEVSTSALAELFKLFKNQVECVLLNACYSEVQANEIVQHINYVIGMNQAIGDKAAIAFARGFYLALGYHQPIERAFDFGKNAIQLEVSGTSPTRSGQSETERKFILQETLNNTPIPEHLKPILKIKPNLRPSISPLSEERKTAIQLEIEQSSQNTSEEPEKVSLFRTKVRECLQKRKIEAFERILLAEDGKELGLSPEEMERIIAEEEAPICLGKEAYKKRLILLIQGNYNLSDPHIQNTLKKIQQERGLTEEEVRDISQPILRDNNLTSHYTEDLGQGIVCDLSDPHIQNTLKKIQQERGLTEEEVRDISQPILRDNNPISHYTEDLGQGIALEMVKIPYGSFMMGTDDAEIERLCQQYKVEWFRVEKPRHLVTLKGFYLGKYPVTQAQYQAVMGENLSYFKGENHPVEQVSWHDAQAFCRKLSEMTGKTYQLPSEAQWEYACRAEFPLLPLRGGSKWCFGDDETKLGEYAWYRANSNDKTHPVGQKKPNQWGLYDMHGNVWEWCEDSFVENYEQTPRDGSAYRNESIEYIVLRGGSWYNYPNNCRSALRNVDTRDSRDYIIGFRVMCAVGKTL